MKALFISVAAGVTGCGHEAAPLSRQDGAVAQAAPITAADIHAYGTGRRREIELTAAALRMLSCTGNAEQRTVLSAGAGSDHVEREAAASAGMLLAEYRRLVARVDEVLRPTLNPDTNTVHVATGPLRGLDSLRVELAVLRARVNAEQSDTHPTRRKPCVAPW